MRLIRLGLLAVALLTALVLPGCVSRSDDTRDDLGTVADFTLTERSGRAVGRDDLKGKVWVAAFVFTCCQQTCPAITANMRRLQDDWKGQGGVVLVSFTVDPAGDTPERLRTYADGHGADADRWLFLTGDQERIYRLSNESFHQYVGENPDPYRTPGNKVEHGNNLFLVDRQGRIRGYFDGTKSEDMDRLRKKVAVMVSPLPGVNAGLNGVATVLLLAGFVAIRARKVRLHTALMLATLGVSALFLTSYLYYHIAVCGGEPTRFQGQGFARSVYLLVLTSHTVLAAVVAPLALFTAYQGLRGRLGRHVRVARWALPIWVYVSLTGVLVYWMLYHLYPAW